MTIREHLEAIRDRNDYPTPWHKRNEDDYADAVAALAILEAAETCQLPALPVAAARRGEPIPAMRHRILRDPELSS